MTIPPPSWKRPSSSATRSGPATAACTSIPAKCCPPREPVLWNTLKTFPENECNASQTANQLFLHRSTMTQCLEKIRQPIRLDTPDERLYVRLCIRMIEQRARSGPCIGAAVIHALSWGIRLSQNGTFRGRTFFSKELSAAAVILNNII